MHGNAERGAVLVSVLLVLALLTGIIVEFDAEARRELRESAAFRDTFKATTLGRAGVQAARAILAHDLKVDVQTGRPYDGLTDIWNRRVSSYPLGDGVIAARIEDERGKLNLNDLATQADPPTRQRYLMRLKRLFELLGITPTLVDAIADWVDADDVVEPYGAESWYYLSLHPPYRAANGSLRSLQELRLVKGFTAEIIRALAPHVTVYPRVGDGWINLNTADPLVIQSLDPRITHATALDIVQQRPFRTAQDLDRVAGLESMGSELRLIGAYGIRSDHFSVQVTATVNDVTRQVSAVIRRPSGVGQEQVISLQVAGGMDES